jgi:hypothetical protein
MNIDWEGLIVGFESRSLQITHFFDRETGDVEQVLEREIGQHAEMSGNPRYIALPRDGGERTLGDLRDFLPHCQDAECRRRLQACLETDAAAAAYREILLSYPKEEAHFFQFKERQALSRAREWLAAQGISIGSSADS